MKKRMQRLTSIGLCFVLALTLLAVSSPVEAKAEKGYTYNYDFWGDTQYSPDAYDVAAVFTSNDLGLETKMSKPGGLYVYNNQLYVCDTGNNRIVVLSRPAVDKLGVVRIIDTLVAPEGVPNTFNQPKDIAYNDGYFFVADYGNGRVVKFDEKLNYVCEFNKPVDATYDQSLDFRPEKIAVDTAGRLYCVAENVNKGLIKYEADTSFSGFIGANKVTYKWTEYIWKKLATQAQRAQMDSFVPTEYENIYMDYEGFFYVCTAVANTTDLYNGNSDAMRRLNLLGSDIMVRNGEYPVIGDQWDADVPGYSGSSVIVDMTAMPNDVFFGLDKTRGRVFAYDDQGRLLFAFGGAGSIDGCFRQPSAIEHIGHDLFVLDALDGSITIFTPNEFGNWVYTAIETFQNGDYEASGNAWQEVLKLNGNYDLAYIGIGRILLQDKQYKEAMEYFKSKYDEDNYSRAFKQYRKEWVEDNIIPILIGLFIVLCVPLMIGKVRAIKREIDSAEIFNK